MVRNRKKRRGGLSGLVAIAMVYVIFWGVLIMAAVMPRSDVVDGLTEEASDGVSVMEIFLNGATLQEIQENGKDIKYEGNMVVFDGVEYDGVEIKGRGNYSWMADKKSYRIKFASKVKLLGMEKSKKWVLIANSVDDSLMRNDLAQYLMGLVREEYPFRGEFVKLAVDGEELGVYYLMRTMDIGKSAVDLRDTMGVLMELDNAYCQAEEIWYKTVMGNCLTIKDAVADDNAEVAAMEFVEDFNALEMAVSEGDYEKVEELADAQSLAEYFVVAELASDPDAYVTSWFMYKDGSLDKIHFGLVWDFDAAFGNRAWGDGGWPEGFYAPTTVMNRMEYTFEKDEKGNYTEELLGEETVKISRMVYEMMQFAEFREMVSEIYTEKIMGRESEVLEFIGTRADSIHRAAEEDALIWDKGDFEEEVEYLKWWMRERMEFFEKTYVERLVKLEAGKV